jgi:hypothetical protein
MLNFSEFNFNKLTLISLGVLFLTLIATNASAQTENAKTEETHSRNTERIILEDHTVINENSSSSPFTPKANIIQKTLPAQVKKDLTAGDAISEKDVKKNDSPSTLSFNIFLYIVDKFKAD